MKFDSLVDALLVHSSDQMVLGEPYYWIDIFAVQQHTGSADAPEWHVSRSSTEQSRQEGFGDMMQDMVADKGCKACVSRTKKQ